MYAIGPEMQYYFMQYITVKCVVGLQRVDDSLSRRVKCKMLWKKRNMTVMTACNEKNILPTCTQRLCQPWQTF